MMRRLSLSLLLGWACTAAAVEGERVALCYNYGCLAEAEVRFDAAALEAIGAELGATGSATEERELLSLALGRLYAIAGTQTPVGADRAGNYLDLGVHGRMDCIDHSTSTTRMLRLLESRGWLRFHRVVEPQRRTRFILQHFSAAVEEIPPAEAGDAADGAVAVPVRYAIDSWFVNNGEAAVVLPLAEWLDGGGPNVQ